MTDALSPDKPRDLVVALRDLVAERTPADLEIPLALKAKNASIKRQYEEAQSQLTERYENEKRSSESQYQAAKKVILSEAESAQRAVQQEYDQVRQDLLARFEAEEAGRRKGFDETNWEATTIFEATRGGLSVQLRELQAQLDQQWDELGELQQEAARVLKKRRQWREYPEPSPRALPPGDAAAQFAELGELARQGLRALSGQTIPRLFEGAQPVAMFLLMCLIAVYPCALAVNWKPIFWVPLSLVSGSILTALLSTWLYQVAKGESTEAYLALRQTLVEADLARRTAWETAKARSEQQTMSGRQRLELELKKAEGGFAKGVAELNQRRQNELKQVDEKYPARLAEIAARRDERLQEVEQRYAQQSNDINQRCESESDRLLKDHFRSTVEVQQQFERQWGGLVERWTTGLAEFEKSVDQINAGCAERFPDWNAVDWSRWKPAAVFPASVPFGQFAVRLGEIEGGLPADPQLRPARTDFTLPALFPFRDRSLILLKADGEGRSRAVQAIQALMLRLLTSMPPGKVRFTILDPVGLGENFSAFMHLADYNDQLVSSRIWTDASHIDQRLADLTGHMENVLQVYLRNEFASIQEYNEFAGEMAEPYRILAVANFPTNFTESAGRRLVSVVASGARCGVYTLMSVDTKLRLPREFHMADLDAHAVTLRWTEDKFVWEHPELGDIPLDLLSPPPDEPFTEIVRSVGRQVKDADRVEVPFSCVAPEDDQWWTADSRSGLDIALGRAGAMKLQHLRLGKGTSQHVLISGKTGSGKSTLLHALITNLAIRYSPDEVELYLVDFKKGVEFKAYAEAELPHARVIAIESEREFGLSVLERLDEELKRRGDLFRNLGVQDVAGYRTLKPDERMPRALLIIDEFQELFVEDDRIAQTAALLLDRLVRQGRAFGIHVLLGSQTLAGSYSLPRSTIGQMAVRIALQCSEADAHLILSEENTAARLLRRPGEAIYNDANGLFEGNHPFQIVWLSDHQRVEYLERVKQLARKRACVPRGQIVFEGNVPADPARNPLLTDLLVAPTWPENPRVAQAWLGAAVAIKEPTFAPFLRQSGNNLLLVGHQEDEALGILATALVSLAAQHAAADGPMEPPGARFYLLDGMRPDSPWQGFWKHLAAMLPHGVKMATGRAPGALIAELAEEVVRREESGQEDAAPAYLIVYDLGRFRDLRKTEDDFSFSRHDEDQPPNPARLFSKILHEGPALGVHTLVWCDTVNSVNRSLDRQGLRDLELRVLFQMNATDSSNLIDSPAASQLGIHRALLYDEGEGRLEKFRPYGPPSDEWLAWVKRQLHARMSLSPR
jgi:energy-coupling factor transporter ATP-binding protein EcfA2